MSEVQAEIGAVPRLSRIDLYRMARKAEAEARYAASWLHPGATPAQVERGEAALRSCAAQLEGLVKQGQPFETGLRDASALPQDERHFETGLRQSSAPPQDERDAG